MLYLQKAAAAVGVILNLLIWIALHAFY